MKNSEPGRVELRQLRLRELRIPFKAAFRHASADRAETSSILVEAISAAGAIGYGESCPRPYVTGETIESARAFALRHDAELRAAIAGLASLQSWMLSQAAELDANPAAWCAIELAVLDLLAKERGCTVEAFLSLPPLRERFRYTAVIGDLNPLAFGEMVERYRRHGFADFKVKLSGDIQRDREKLDVLSRHRPIDGRHLRIRVDANNLWDSTDEAIRFLSGLDCPLFAVEEPIRPNGYGELMKIAGALECRIVLDESFVRADQVALLPRSEATVHDPWLINLRVSKMGGLLRSLEAVARARSAGIGVIVGAQVGETSLLTRAALTVATAAADLLIAQEGAFGTFLLTEDIVDPPLTFGAGGVLETSTYAYLKSPGLGFDDVRI
jgi:L-Ala-D/L-Glu epimerase